MKIQYFGHSCFALRYENGTVLVTDPFDASVTYAPCDTECSAALVSHDHFDHNHTASLKGDFQIIRQAGESEIGGIRIAAMPSFHDEKGGALRGSNLLFRIEGEGISIAHLGDLGHMPDARQAEFLKDLDLLLLPIGGTYTIDTGKAEALIDLLKPRHAIAMHFKTEAYPSINIATCEAFARDMHAAFMPREIDVRADQLHLLPETMILNYR